MAPDPAAQPELHEALHAARSSLGEYANWLLVEPDVTGARTGEAIGLAELMADGGAGIQRVVDRWQAIWPGDPGGAPAVLGAVAWGFFHPQLVAVRDARRLITVDVARARIDLLGGEDDPTRVWWPCDTTAEVVADDDPAVEAAYRRLVEQAVTVLEPLVELIRSQVSLGRRGLWAHVVDTFNGVGPRYGDADPDRRCAELALVERARTGTPLAQRAVVVDVDRPDGRRRVVRTSACCLAYLAPHRDLDASLPWSAGPWADYCMRCPLIPVEETVRRAHHWLDCDVS